MESIYLWIPAVLLLTLLAAILFIWAVRNGQYDDLDRDGHNDILTRSIGHDRLQLFRGRRGGRFVEQTGIAKSSWSNALSDWAFFMGNDTVAEGIAIPINVSTASATTSRKSAWAASTAGAPGRSRPTASRLKTTPTASRYAR